MIDEPQNVDRQDNSSIATKFASRIMTELLPALGIYPEGEIDYLLPGTDDNSDEVLMITNLIKALIIML